MNYENKYSGEIISESFYRSLPEFRKKDYKITSSSITHEIKDDGIDIITTAIAVSSMISDFPSDSPSIDTNSSDFSFGGGDFGGGGASGDF